MSTTTTRITTTRDRGDRYSPMEWAQQLSYRRRRQRHGERWRGAASYFTLTVFIVDQNLFGIAAVVLVVFYRHLGTHVMCHMGPLCETTSSTKPEVYTVSQHCQRRTDRATANRQHAQKSRSSVASRVVFDSDPSYTSEQTDKQTYPTQYFALFPRIILVINIEINTLFKIFHTYESGAVLRG